MRNMCSICGSRNYLQITLVKNGEPHDLIESFRVCKNTKCMKALRIKMKRVLEEVNKATKVDTTPRIRITYEHMDDYISDGLFLTNIRSIMTHA